MSQNDFVIENALNVDLRPDMNSAFQALASQSSGASAPTTIYAYQAWADTTNNLLKMRNGANTAWMTLAKFDTVNDRWEPNTNVIQALTTAGVTIKNAAGTTIGTLSDGGLFTTGAGGLTLGGPLVATGQQIQNADEVTIASAAALPITTASNSFYVTGTAAITSMATVPAGTEFTVRFAAALTLTHNATSLILPGAANITTAAGDIFRFRSHGSGNYRMIGGVKADGTAIVAPTVESYRTLLETVTVSTAVATVDLTAFDHAKYSRYQIEVESYKPAVSNPILMRFSSDGGSTFLTSGYVYGYIGVSSGGTAASVASGSQAYIYSGVTQAASGAGRMFLEISDMADSAEYTTLDGTSSNGWSQGAIYDFVGSHGTKATHNAVQFRSGSGNINAGKFRLYGLV